jgi:homoserine dehydrogenase
MKKIRLAILGLGNIGKGVQKLLEMNSDLIFERTGIALELTKVLEINEETINTSGLSRDIFTSNIEDISKADNIDIAIEVLGGINPATDFVLSCLTNGKSVVTSNKAMLAPSYNKILKTAEDNNVFFGYEASVGGGIPIIDALTNSLAANQYKNITGILNGTTNYVLTKMTDEGWEYEDALKKAQELGFAEPDPTDDVTAKDVVNKISILMNLAFGEFVSPEQIKPIGITEITQKDIEEARAQNCVIKLLASASYDNGELNYFVQPTFLNKEHPLATIKNETNAILVEGNAVSEVMLVGPGAGPLPTASAIMGDVVSIAKKLTCC